MSWDVANATFRRANFQFSYFGVGSCRNSSATVVVEKVCHTSNLLFFTITVRHSPLGRR